MRNRSEKTRKDEVLTDTPEKILFERENAKKEMEAAGLQKQQEKL